MSDILTDQSAPASQQSNNMDTSSGPDVIEGTTSVFDSSSDPSSQQQQPLFGTSAPLFGTSAPPPTIPEKTATGSPEKKDTSLASGGGGGDAEMMDTSNGPATTNGNKLKSPAAATNGGSIVDASYADDDEDEEGEDDFVADEGIVHNGKEEDKKDESLVAEQSIDMDATQPDDDDEDEEKDNEAKNESNKGDVSQDKSGVSAAADTSDKSSPAKSAKVSAVSAKPDQTNEEEFEEFGEEEETTEEPQAKAPEKAIAVVEDPKSVYRLPSVKEALSMEEIEIEEVNELPPEAEVIDDIVPVVEEPQGDSKAPSPVPEEVETKKSSPAKSSPSKTPNKSTTSNASRRFEIEEDDDEEEDAEKEEEATEETEDADVTPDKSKLSEESSPKKKPSPQKASPVKSSPSKKVEAAEEEKEDDDEKEEGSEEEEDNEDGDEADTTADLDASSVSTGSKKTPNRKLNKRQKAKLAQQKRLETLAKKAKLEESDAKEEEQEEDEEEEAASEEKEEEQTPGGRRSSRGRASNGATPQKQTPKKAPVEEEPEEEGDEDGEQEEEEKEKEESEEPAVKGRRSVRGGRASATPKKADKTVDEPEEDDDESTTSGGRRSLRGRSTPQGTPKPEAKRTPRAATRATPKALPAKSESEEPAEEDEEQQQEDTEMEDAQQEEDTSAVKTPASGGRALRGRRSTAATPATPVADTPRGRKRGQRQASASVSADDDEAADEPTTPARGGGRGRRSDLQRTPEPAAKRTRTQPASAHTTPTQAQSTAAARRQAQTEPRGGSKKKGVRAANNKASPEDPFSMEEHFDDHPRPMAAIQSVIKGGTVSFIASPSVATPTGGSRYSMTKRAEANSQQQLDPAKKRVSLTTTSPTTPGQTSTTTTTTPKPASTPNSTQPRSTPSGSQRKSSNAMDTDESPAESPAPAPTPKSGGRGRRSAGAKPATPRTPRVKVELPVLTPIEQANVDKTADCDKAHFDNGARVFAKWGTEYYPAHVVQPLGFGRFKVLFVADKMVRDLPSADIVPLNRVELGKTIMLLCELADGSEELRPVNITQAPSLDNAEEWQACLFKANELDTKQERTIFWTKFIIDHEQKPLYDSGEQFDANTISEANISSRRTREHSKVSTPKEIYTPDPIRTNPIRRGLNQQQSDHENTPRSSTKPAARRSISNTGSARKSTGTTGGSTKAEKASAAHGSGLFAGLCFVLTSATRKKGDDDDSAGAGGRNEPFNKKDVRKRINEFGGRVVDDFSAADLDSDRCYLIADTHYRTHKYLSALARAVPCVRHHWILDCIVQETLLEHDSYMLPAGDSLEQNKQIAWHDRGPNLLKGKTVMVYTMNRPGTVGTLDFVQIWVPLVKCMGASAVTQLKTNDSTKIDYLLTDASCPDDILKDADERDVPVLSSEWLIQAVICGALPAVDGHDKYRYDYTEERA